MKDGFGRSVTYLRLSVTDKCNLRCRYCMGEEGVCKKRHEDMLTEEEMVTAVEAAASLGVRKLRITGGEPLIKKNVLSLCRRCGAVDGIEELCLTTNGVLLPDYAAALKDCGVSRVNVSLDTLRPDRYAHITRTGELSDALRGVESALSAGFERVKLNTVLIGGFNDDEIADLAALTMRYPLDVRFIELMPMVDGAFGPDAFVPCTRVLDALPELMALPGGGDGVARLYQLPGARGRIGLISPLHQSFCHLCNRIRITADGMVKPCLHHRGEFPLKGLSRAEMEEQLKRAIAAKPRGHGHLSCASPSLAGRPMHTIGG